VELSTSADDIEAFYRSLSTFSDMCHSGQFVATLQPTVGKVLIFDNHRCLHSRTQFAGPRLMCGSYVALDDYLSMLNRSRLLRGTSND
jgi:trimethyllysine dioxygenase